MKIYSVYNEVKSDVPEKPMRTLENKLYKYVTVVSKNKYIDKLGNIVDKYNTSYQRRIKVKPANFKSGMYIEFGVELSSKDP